ncbi:MAG: phosphatase PAP2 family protein [Pirellulaceae bacterium]|nr:phosphatase PAP2 family protein [Pirellulaceae bacterium]
MTARLQSQKYKTIRRTTTARSLSCESLEERRLLAFEFANSFNACDVNDDGYVSPIDALIVINALHAGGSRELPPVELRPVHFLDVDVDRNLAPSDVLQVINRLNEISRSTVQPPVITGGLSPDSDADGNGIVLKSQVTINGQTLPNAKVRLTIGDSNSASGEGDSALTTTDLRSVADAQGHFSFTVNLPSGMSTVRMMALDALGQGSVITREVRLGDVVLDWNASLLNVIRDWTTLSNDPYTNRVVTERPPVAARNLAMVHAAMYDAVNAIEKTHQPYHVDVAAPAGASPVAAAAAAAQRVASQLYQEADERAVFDAALAESLATVPDGPGKSAGIALGQQVGDAILAWRSSDGASANIPYTPGKKTGDWNRTFPDFLPSLLPQWPKIVPFAMPSGSQFRPAAPPPLDSAEYAANVDEVMQIGGLNSSSRSVEQSEIAIFWADGGGTFTPAGHWNQIASDVSLATGASMADNARLFALLNIAMADAGIAAWDAKYAFNLWRPIDAIRRGDTDGNLLTIADPNWTPLLKSPPFPTYTSGHSTFSGAADAVLTSFFGPDFHFTTTADGHNGFTQRPLSDQQVKTRSFNSFTQAANEAGRSRIYGGIHFAFDNTAGLSAGRSIGRYVIEHLLEKREN